MGRELTNTPAAASFADGVPARERGRGRGSSIDFPGPVDQAATVAIGRSQAGPCLKQDDRISFLQRWQRLAAGVRQQGTRFGWRGVSFAFQEHFIPHPRRVRVPAPGIPSGVVLRTRTSDLDVYIEVFEDRIYDVELARPPRTIVDCGANIGLASVLFAQRYPQARIVAIEPDRESYALCRRNCRRYPNIETIHAAVWHEEAKLVMTDPEGYGSWGMRTEPHPERARRKLRTVRGQTLDALMREHGLDTIDLLKVDIEGAELELFADPGAWIERVNVIFIECHDWIRPDCEATVRRATAAFPIARMVGATQVLARAGMLAPSGHPNPD
jgi:FkbM family methyltransferase